MSGVIVTTKLPPRPAWSSERTCSVAMLAVGCWPPTRPGPRPTSSASWRSRSSARGRPSRIANASFICTTRCARSVTTTRSMSELNVSSSRRRWFRMSSRSWTFSMPAESCRPRSPARSRRCRSLSSSETAPSTTSVPRARRQPRNGVMRTGSGRLVEDQRMVQTEPPGRGLLGVARRDAFGRRAVGGIRGGDEPELTCAAVVQPDRGAPRADMGVELAEHGLDRGSEAVCRRNPAPERPGELPERGLRRWLRLTGTRRRVEARVSWWPGPISGPSGRGILRC